jgi:hypothetical protein
MGIRFGAVGGILVKNGDVKTEKKSVSLKD